MLRILSITLITSLIILVSACSDDPSSPEQQVRDTLQAIEIAAEERSMSDLMGHIAEDYSDHQGNDKDSIRRILQLLFLRNQSINVFSLIRSLEFDNGIAAVEISTAMASRDIDLNQEANRLKADSLRFSVVLQEDNGEWLVSSVSWQRGWGS